MSFRAICLFLATPLLASASIVSSGTVTIPGTFHFDFDAGIVDAHNSESDVFWNIAISADVLQPYGQGSVVNIGNFGSSYFDGLSVSDLQTLTYSNSTAIDSSLLVAGDVFAVETSDGNYAKALVTGPFDRSQDVGLPIQWVTFSPAAATAPEPGSIALGLCGFSCLTLIRFKLCRRGI